MDEKFIKNAQNGHFDDFLKLEACCQTVLPDRSMFKGQNLAENATLWVIFKHCESGIHFQILNAPFFKSK